MLLLLLYVALAIGVSFLCSTMEAVLLSVTPGYLVAMEQSNQRIAARLKRLKDDIDEPLAAILSLNTIAHTFGAAGAGAQAAHVFGDAWLGLFSVLIVPLKPLVWMSGLASRKISAEHDPVHVSRDEISALADLGARKGVLDEEESRVVNALLRSRSLSATDIMTPRTVVFALPADETVRAVVDRHQPLRFSRIPIYSGSIDALVGFVLKAASSAGPVPVLARAHRRGHRRVRGHRRRRDPRGPGRNRSRPRDRGRGRQRRRPPRRRPSGLAAASPAPRPTP
jgi:CBS domain containing-hemolysin-like protein